VVASSVRRLLVRLEQKIPSSPTLRCRLGKESCAAVYGTTRRWPVAGHRCADLSSEGDMHLEEPMDGADAPEPEAEATTGLGADT
jgi:hypothetical protein